MRRLWLIVGVVALIAGTVWINDSRSGTKKREAGEKVVPNLNLDVGGWLPWWDNGSGLATFKNNSHTFSEIHSFQFHATSITDIQRQGTAAHSSSLASAIHKAKAADIPTLTEDLNTADFTAVLNDPDARSRHAQAVCTFVTSNNFDGIDIDYESFVLNLSSSAAPSIAPLFTSLISEMATCLHQHKKTIEITVLPRTGDPRWAYFETHLSVTAFDYAALGKVVDFIQPMAYDFSYPGSAPGSTDPIEWVKAVVKFTTDRVARSKIQLGLPLYGYDWVTRGKAVTADAATNLAKQNNVIPTRDVATQSLVFTYTDATGNNHTVWYDDAQATALRVAVARDQGLNGVSFWALGDEQSGLWSTIIALPKTTTTTAGAS